MSSPFDGVSDERMLDLATALERGARAATAAIGSLPPRAARWLGARQSEGLAPSSLSAVLRCVVDERRRERDASATVELVWTGPSESRIARDTFIVVEQLFERAERSILLSSYSVFDGRSVLQTLHERLRAVPSLQVQLVLDVERSGSRSQSLDEFARKFVRWHWPGPPWPALYFDPRSLSEDAHACMHAKCIVVDNTRALVTSANLSESAQRRNYEAGVLVDDPTLCTRLGGLFLEAIQRRALEQFAPTLLERAWVDQRK
jgi:phosphatidylserine/phosphatidylglycerophosphate/cardiolipin synthase-like enzyme